MNLMRVAVQKLHESAILPTYAYPGDACFDLHTIDSCTLNSSLLNERARGFLRTGLAFEIPIGHVMLLFSRSGMALKGARLSNCVGVIDSGYRGEVIVPLTNDSNSNVTVNAGDRVAQAMIIPLPYVEFRHVSELLPSVRDRGGFGSSGL
jgi:dUTP pyrophosphatase